jgi:hypothetical protein
VAFCPYSKESTKMKGTRDLTLKDLIRKESDIVMGGEYRISGFPGRYRVVDEYPRYVVFLHHGKSEMFGQHYEYPVSFHRADLLEMNLVPGPAED